MKQCRELGALRGFSRLKAEEFAPLLTYLRAARDEEVEALKKARDMDSVARSQACADAIETILKYVEDGESLAQKYRNT